MCGLEMDARLNTDFNICGSSKRFSICVRANDFNAMRAFRKLRCQRRLDAFFAFRIELRLPVDAPFRYFVKFGRLTGSVVEKSL